MQIVIDIPNEEVPSKQEIIDINLHFIAGEVCECTYPYMVLPKGHGRLIDADALIDSLDASDRDIYCKAVIEEEAPIIIEADKEYEAEVITRGKCMMCGKELTEGLFFCKECGDKANSGK